MVRYLVSLVVVRVPFAGGLPVAGGVAVPEVRDGVRAGSEGPVGVSLVAAVA